MDVLATMKAYRKATGAYLGRSEVIANCDCCTDLDSFEEHHGADVAEFLHDTLQRRIEDKTGVLYTFGFVELEEVDEDEDERKYNDFVKSAVRWLD